MAQEIRRRTNADQILGILGNDQLLPRGNDLVVFKEGKQEVIHCKNRVHKLVLKIINLITPGVTVYSEGAIGRTVKNTIKELNKESAVLQKLINKGDGLESLENLRTILETFKENKTQIKMIKIWTEKHDPENKGVKSFNEFQLFICDHINEKFTGYMRAMNLGNEHAQSPQEALRFLHAYNELVFFRDILEKAPEALKEGDEVEKEKSNFNVFIKQADEKYEKIKETADSKTRELIDTGYQIIDKLTASKLTFEEAEKSFFEAFNAFAGAWEHQDVKKYLKESVLEGFRNIGDAHPLLKGVVEILKETDLDKRREFLTNPDLKALIDTIKLEVDKDEAQIRLIETRYNQILKKSADLEAEKNEVNLANVEHELEQLLRKSGFLVERPVFLDNGLDSAYHIKEEILDADPHRLTQEQVQKKITELIQRSTTSNAVERTKIKDQLQAILTNQNSILELIKQRDQLQGKINKLAEVKRKAAQQFRTVESNIPQKVGMEPFSQMLTQVQELILLANDAQEKDWIYKNLSDQKLSLEKNLEDSIKATKEWNEVKLTAGNKPVKIG